MSAWDESEVFKGRYAPMDVYTEDRLRAAIAAAKPRVQAVGPMHSDWDVIFDGECLLQGKQTFLSGSRDELLRKLTDMLEKGADQLASNQTERP